MPIVAKETTNHRLIIALSFSGTGGKGTSLRQTFIHIPRQQQLPLLLLPRRQQQLVLLPPPRQQQQLLLLPPPPLQPRHLR